MREKSWCHLPLFVSGSGGWCAVRRRKNFRFVVCKNKSHIGSNSVQPKQRVWCYLYSHYALNGHTNRGTNCNTSYYYSNQYYLCELNSFGLFCLVLSLLKASDVFDIQKLDITKTIIDRALYCVPQHLNKHWAIKHTVTAETNRGPQCCVNIWWLDQYYLH